MKHNNTISLYERNQEESYNLQFIDSFGFVNCKTITVDKFNTEDPGDANAFMVVWLKNIDRCVELLGNRDLTQYDLIDVGCGNGLSTIYFAINYGFNSFLGFDFEENLINFAKQNFLRTENIPHIGFDVKDARNYKLQTTK